MGESESLNRDGLSRISAGRPPQRNAKNATHTKSRPVAPMDPALTKNASAVDGTMYESRADSVAAVVTSPSLAPQTQTEIPRLPPELILEIAKRTPLATRLEMAFSSKENYFLIIPYAANEILARRCLACLSYINVCFSLSDFEDDRHAFSSESEVTALAQDALGADKFGMLHKIAIYSRELPCLINSGILNRCAALRQISVEIDSVEALDWLATSSLPNLSFLEISLSLPPEEYGGLETPTFSFPRVDELVIHGKVPSRVLKSIVQGCQRPISTRWHVSFHGNEELQDVDDKFFETVRTVKFETAKALLPLLGRKAFRPETIVQEEESNIGWNLTGPDNLLVWNGCVKWTLSNNLKSTTCRQATSSSASLRILKSWILDSSSQLTCRLATPRGLSKFFDSPTRPFPSTSPTTCLIIYKQRKNCAHTPKRSACGPT